ncbi:hypothetical protein Clacol_008327 [Clathrus columnatus]|uniref:DUF6534 domain-containing protein n=1 Tax=Clathrus columnatus TaxID=1419009 RepID=A0AAV5AI50_9AGAM|nr:hypothetical protein Clacol_008327 [Clathrus columnatus]
MAIFPLVSSRPSGIEDSGINYIPVIISCTESIPLGFDFIRSVEADTTQLIAGFLSAFLVQMYFAYCVYTSQTVLTTILGSFAKLDSTKPSTTVQAIATVLCDIAITISLTTLLDRGKSFNKQTDSIIKTLIINAINRGLVTSVFATLNLILFLALPGTFIFFIALMPTSKLYMNTLNSRQHIKEKGKQGLQSIQLQSVITNPSLSFNSAERNIVFNRPSMTGSTGNLDLKRLRSIMKSSV